jgi:hypothetical protein
MNYGEVIDFNELRRQLDLPVAEAVDPATTDLSAMPLVRLHRVEPKQLTDEQLTSVWQRAVQHRAKVALSRLAPEVTDRTSMSAANRAQAHGILAGFSADFDKSLTHLAEARQLSKSAGQSCAGWDLEELAVRLAVGKPEGFMELVQHISTAHRSEPGVLERLFQFMYSAGLIDEQGRPMRAAAPAAGELVVPGGGAAASGKIWTPDGEAGEAKKSALWVPGT